MTEPESRPEPDVVIEPVIEPGEHRVPWSVRATPAALVALLVLVGSGALLYDVVAVRAGRRAGSWRVRIAEELATRHLDSGWVIAGAAVAAALGCWLGWLAVSPGRRRWLALRQEPGALIDRSGVAALLERRALDLTMVAGARARVSRRRARVTLLGSADLAGARTALAAELDRIGLVAAPRLSVRGRPAKHRPPMH